MLIFNNQKPLFSIGLRMDHPNRMAALAMSILYHTNAEVPVKLCLPDTTSVSLMTLDAKLPVVPLFI